MFWKRYVADKTQRCSFCRKEKHLVGDLISSPSNDSPFNDLIYICSECVFVCDTILENRRRDKEEHSSAQRAAAPELAGLDNHSTPVVPDKTVSIKYTIGRGRAPRSY
jgi:ATP-dependent protease Clp ATPase subunit